MKNSDDKITLSNRQQREVGILTRLQNRLITNAEAARELGLSVRQVQRKKKAFDESGMAAVIHKNAGKTPNNAYSDAFKEKIVELYKSEYFGWNFSHFRDILEEEHDINVSRAFVHNLLRAYGVKSPNRKKKRKDKAHPPRPRRENAGELIQVDASKHQWLYGTDEHFYLHGAIDDATGTVTACFLMKQETTLGYQILMRDTIKRYGIPEALYTDYRTVFQSNKRLTLDETLRGKQIGATKFAKMLKRLGVDIYSTEDPRSKGRIERLWRTFQDRLIKELYKEKIDTMEMANEYIDKIFLPKYNARFASPINPDRNVFVKVSSSFNYDRELALWFNHSVLENCYIKHMGRYYEIKKYGMTAKIRTSEKVRVYQGLNGKLFLEHGDEWYDLEEIKRVARERKSKPKKTAEEISRNNSCAAKINNSPWRKTNALFFSKRQARRANAGGDISEKQKGDIIA